MGNGKARDQQWYRHGLVADLSRSPIKWEKLPETEQVVRAHATEVFGGNCMLLGDQWYWDIKYNSGFGSRVANGLMGHYFPGKVV